MNTTSVEVTAGLGGFLVLFGLALAVWFLGRDLTRRLRRMTRAEEDRLAATAPADDVPAADVPVDEVPADDARADDAPVQGEAGAEPDRPVPPRGDSRP